VNACALCATGIARVWDGVLECYSHVDTDNPGKLRICATPWAPQPKPFWDSVSELAAMREHIPEERRAGSLVRRFFDGGDDERHE